MPCRAAGRTDHQAKITDPAMQEQVRAEILDQFHLRLTFGGIR
jgi:hypothetical protein